MSLPLPEPTFIGLTATNWILAAAAVTGPIVAVVITIIAEHYRSRAQRRTQIVYSILNTRHRANDIQYQMAITAVGVEFRKDEAVMAAHREYMNHVSLTIPAGGEIAHHQQLDQKLLRLMALLFKRVGTALSEAEIAKMSYYTVALSQQDDLLHDALAAIPRVALTLENQEKILRGLPVDATPASKDPTTQD